MSKPDSAARLEELGNAHHAQGRLEDAILAYREALEREPIAPAPCGAWGVPRPRSAIMPPRPRASAGSWRSSPITARGSTTWADPLYELGQVDRALEAFQRAFHSLPPEARTVPLTNMAMVIPGDPWRSSNQEILDCRRAWATHACLRGPTARISQTGFAAGTGRLRLGYVSAYFARRNWMKPVWGPDQPPRPGTVRDPPVLGRAAARRPAEGYTPIPATDFHETSGSPTRPWHGSSRKSKSTSLST